MAQTLIESMSAPWEPEKYKDEYRDAVLELIEQKAQNKEIAGKAPAAPRSTNVVDLVKVLQESLNRNQSLKPKRSGEDCACDEWQRQRPLDCDAGEAEAAASPLKREPRVAALDRLRAAARTARASALRSFGPMPLSSCLK